MNIPEKILSQLTEEQKKKVEAAQTPEELLALAKETGYELSPEQLEAVSGGWCGLDCGSFNPDCPYYST
jgi:hypothetical protein